ncbi:hypothetical protein Y032_0199g1645 [Ancylostoma ceylanicum]|uniref:Uncharacterized protein n=2 Tax=Ancylostoma ceylanicum TaxID=53326 RepID=A0A016SNR0_9BILA|nr:hypothetical protein Y032_0199g1645 [Ancylostoma ceylanicum]
MKPVFIADEKWCLYVNIKRSPSWVDKDKQHEPQPKARLHPLEVMITLYRPDLVPRDYRIPLTLSNALQGKTCDDEDDLDRWLSNFVEPMLVQISQNLPRGSSAAVSVVSLEIKQSTLWQRMTRSLAGLKTSILRATSKKPKSRSPCHGSELSIEPLKESLLITSTSSCAPAMTIPEITVTDNDDYL